MKASIKTFILLLFTAVILIPANAQPKLWGTLPLGGSTEAGLVYQLDLNGNNFEEIYDFKQYLGRYPKHHIILADNNKFYGLAQDGYGQNASVIYEYDPVSEEYVVAHDFYDLVTQTSISTASSYLVQASDGLIYGFNQEGGLNTDGQLFSFKPGTDEFSYLAEFEVSTTGSYPMGGLVEAGNGKLYGTTMEGGLNNDGVLFSFDPSTNALDHQIDFDAIGAEEAVNGMIMASNGLLYGMTRKGGANNLGTIYAFEPGTGIITLLHEFNPATDGSRPYGRLFQASDGYLYGMTSEGGGTGKGIIFRYDIILGLFNVVYSFDGPSGDFPLGGFVEHNGFLYAMTSNGGVSDKGVLFRFDLSTYTLEKLADFYGNEYGEYPDGSLTLGPDGNLYGQTFSGGKYGIGVMFMYNTSSMLFTKCFDFNDAPDGSIIFSQLMKASDGMVYATTQYGGSYSAGTIYRIDPANRQFESIYDFDLLSTGGGPYDGLMEASDGYLYGVTTFGGSTNFGTIYRFNESSGVLTVIHDLLTISEGQEPRGIPLEHPDGMLYGVTRAGGANSVGCIYQFNLSTSVYTKKADFDALTSGSYPVGSLIKAANGKLYGLASSGGQHTYGTLFEYDPNLATMQAMAFDGLNKGRIPIGTLIEYEDNMLYGMCHMGGFYDEGTLFVIDLNALESTKLMDFNPATTGYKPMGSLIKASNNKLYGTTSRGGAYNSGVIFEYDPSNGTYTTIHEFTSFREYPWFGALLEVETEYGIDDKEDSDALVSVFPNPASSSISVSARPGAYRLAVFNQLGQLISEKEVVLESDYASIDIEDYEVGIYTIQLRSDEINATAKFIKSK